MEDESDEDSESDGHGGYVARKRRPRRATKPSRHLMDDAFVQDGAELVIVCLLYTLIGNARQLVRLCNGIIYLDNDVWVLHDG